MKPVNNSFEKIEQDMPDLVAWSTGHLLDTLWAQTFQNQY